MDNELTSLTAEELVERERAIKIERERRENLASIPDQVRELAKVYRDGGGDEDALQDAITEEEQDDD